ncbi:MAG: SMP-30/gluconolactonase/LRE family protein [Sandaracinaceae bacterium]|nr:SMP-30/gluconolactonase/LRE family protein [Sandaracinaceae bacterium]
MRALLLLAALGALGCDGSSALDAGSAVDAAALDGGSFDAASRDAATTDAGGTDGGGTDGGATDAGATSICPPGSESLVLDLGGASLAPVAGVPIRDGFVTGFEIVEGPVWARGALYVSHFGSGPAPASRIYRVAPDGSVAVAAPNAGVNGLALGPDGRLYGGRHLDGTVSVFDWDDLAADPTPVVEAYMGARFDSPNDLVLRSDGTIYFTDPAWQSPVPEPQAARRAYRVAPDGTIEAIPGTPDRPNGIALTRDERALFVTGTDGLRRYDLNADGTLASAAMNVPAVSGGLDGLGLDCAGNLYVAGGDAVTVLDPSLTEIGVLPAPGATNVAFGGDDRRTLYVTALGASAGLSSVTLNVPGYPH